jgi:threonine dehydrogenase-like Zn-dependent dehydrogenase
MRAVIFKGVGEVAVEDRPIPTIQDPRDAIVKVTASGLCGSDMHWYRGHAKNRTGFIPGHEVVGIIHEIGSAVTGFRIGDHVVVSSMVFKRSCFRQRFLTALIKSPFTAQCGECFYCKRKETSCCEQGFRIGGIFSFSFFLFSPPPLSSL